MANLAGEFQRQGAKVTVLTALWNPRWPAEFTHRGARVVRLRQPPVRMWGTYRYMQALSDWLTQHASELDLVYVSMFKHDAYAALGALKPARVPVAIRGEGAGLSGDMHWQLDALGGRQIKRRTMSAAAFIAPSRAIEAEITAAGYPRGRIRFIANGVAPADVEDRAARRAAARDTLASHRELDLAPAERLVVYTGRLHEAKGLIDLVRAWPAVLEAEPWARLWIAGEGPLRERLAKEISEQGLSGVATLAGSFDAVDDLLAAADAFVLPSHEEGMSVALLEAMAAGLPVVASDIPGNRQLVDHDVHGLLVPAGDQDALAGAIVRALSDARCGTWSDAARSRVASDFSLERSAREHLTLFERLIAEARR